MTGKAAWIMLVLALGVGCLASGAQAQILTPVDIGGVLASVGIDNPWHYDVALLDKNKPSWELDAYHDARQAAPDVCLAHVTAFLVGGAGPTRNIMPLSKPQPVAAFGRCDEVWKGHCNIVSIDRDIAEPRVLATIEIVRRLLAADGDKTSMTVRFETEALRRVVARLTLADAIAVETKGEVATVMTFTTKAVDDAHVAIEVTAGGNRMPVLYVSRRDLPKF